jgi:hypothetical protein
MVGFRLVEVALLRPGSQRDLAPRPNRPYGWCSLGRAGWEGWLDKVFPRFTELQQSIR